jgi:hypothetical protein
MLQNNMIGTVSEEMVNVDYEVVVDYFISFCNHQLGGDNTMSVIAIKSHLSRILKEQGIYAGYKHSGGILLSHEESSDIIDGIFIIMREAGVIAPRWGDDDNSIYVISGNISRMNKYN